MIVYNNQSGLTEVYLGTSNIAEVYIGSNKVFPTVTPPTRVKFSAVYSDSSTYSVDCDADSTLTTATTQPYGRVFEEMTSAVVGDCITIINDFAFETQNGATSKLASVYIPSSVTTIRSFVFYRCNALTSMTIPDSVTSIGSNMFNGCRSLTSVTLPNNLSYLNINTFQGCSSLTSVTIPNSATNIGDGAFYGCSSLANINIPSGVTDIGAQVFYGCTSLTSITVNAVNPPTLGSSAFNYTNDCPIYVPDASVDAYKTANRWSNYANRIKPISEKP